MWVKTEERDKERWKVKPCAPVELYFLWSNASAATNAATVVVDVVGEYAFITVVDSSASFVSFENGEIFKMV